MFELTPFFILAFLAFAIQWLMFVPSWIFHTEKYFDLTGSLTYITLALLAIFLFGNDDPRTMLLGLLVIIWAVRLGLFLFGRVSQAGEDRRFRKIKQSFPLLLMVWSLQGAWVTITFGAGLAAMTSNFYEPLGLFAAIGVFLWIFGFAIEVIADRQKTNFRSDPENQETFIQSGLWSYSRHPNYLGEIMLWSGIAIIALPVLDGWWYLTLVSPFWVTLLLTKISGIRLLEERAERTWGNDANYQAYKNRTPVLIPKLSRKLDHR